MSLISSAGTPQPNLAWTFESSNVDYVTGLTPSVTSGTITYNPSGKYGYSANIYNPTSVFSNAILYGTTGSALTPAISTVVGFTVCFWFRPHLFYSVGNTTFFGIGGTDGTYNSFINVLGIASSRLNLYCQNPTNPTYVGQSGNSPVITPGTWNHVAIVCSPGVSYSTITGYVNNTLWGTQFTTNTTALGTFSVSSIGLGRHPFNTATPGTAEFDDLRIYNTALSATQVQSIYNQQGMPGLGALIATSAATTTLTGTPLFSQLSASATSSAVGAFSLRAVNGLSGTARAVQVSATASLPSFTASVTSIGSNAYSQSLTGYSFGGTGIYVATGSSIYSTTISPPWKAFDSDTTTWWETTVGLYNTSTNGGTYTGGQTITIDGVPTSCEWLIIQVPTGITLSSYSMYARSGFTYRMPKNFKIAGSNDGSTWTTVDTRTNQTTWTGQTPITFTTTSSTVYTYFALCVTAITSQSGSTNNLSVGQWTLNGSWQTDFYADRLGNLLTAPVTGQTLADWLGGATGYVTTWYDQSGKGNHATQATTANQPIIQRATKGPGYSCLFNGSTNYMNFGSSTILNGTNYSVCGSTRRNVSGGGRYYIGSAGTNLQFQQLSVGYFTDTSTILNEGAYAQQITVPAYAGASEPVTYENWSMSQTTGIYDFSWRAGATYNNGNTGLKTPLSSAGNGIIGATASNGSYSGYFSGEMFELLIFNASLFDLSGSGSGQLSPIPSIIQSIYNNQLSYTGT